MNTARVDVLIVGAGLVGASMALALSRAELGVQIGLVDHKTLDVDAHPDAEGRAIALSYGSCMLLKQLKIWEAIQKDATPIHTVHVSRKGRWGIVRLSRETVGLPALGYVVPARRLLQGLYQAILAHHDLVVWQKTQLTHLYAGGVTMQQIEGTSPSQVFAPLIIGADGTHSVVRRCAGIETQSIAVHPSKALVVPVQSTQSHHQVAYERLLPDGVLALLPSPMGPTWSTVVWTAPPSIIDAFDQSTDRALLDSIQAALGQRLGRLLALGQRQTYGLTPLKAVTQVQPGLVLLGNAAHTHHPIAAQGLNLSLRDVDQLVSVIRHAWNDHIPLGDQQVLNQYLNQRVPDQKRTQHLTMGLMRVSSLAAQSCLVDALCGWGFMGMDMFKGLQRLWMRHPLGFL